MIHSASPERKLERHPGRSRSVLVFILLSVLLVVAFLISMNWGYIRLQPLDVIRTIFGYGTSQQELILYQFRLPRIVISLMVGVGFALSGAILQGITRNPLAESGILGINAGAGLVVVLYISLRSSATVAPAFLMPLLALAGSVGAGLLVYGLAYKKHEGISQIRLVLIGIAVQGAISAGMIVLTLAIDPEKYQFAATWLAGSLWGTNWKFVLAFLPWLIILVPYTLVKSQTLNVLSLGDQLSVGLGARLQRERLLLLLTAVALAGSSVAIGGSISFVGLIGPHLARQLIGSRHQALLPASALCGGLLMLVADSVSRNSDIPTGILVAIIGAPYFLYLMARRS